MSEIWKVIPNFDNKYLVSNKGNVKNILRNFLLKQETTKLNYKRVCLYRNGSCKKFFVHRLVANAFIPNPHSLPYVNHIDENPSNNNVDNLEWCTQKYNINYGTRNLKVSNHARHVKQYSLDGVFLAEYQSIMVVEKLFGFDPSNIYKCCKNNTESAYNFIWKYA